MEIVLALEVWLHVPARGTSPSESRFLISKMRISVAFQGRAGIASSGEHSLQSTMIPVNELYFIKEARG